MGLANRGLRSKGLRVFNKLKGEFEDSFEDQDLNEYTATDDFGTTTSKAYDGSVALQCTTGGAHTNIRYGSAQFSAGDNLKATIYQDMTNTARGGVTLVTSTGDGYAVYADNVGGNLKIRNCSEDNIGTDISSTTTTFPADWVKLIFEYDGTDTLTATADYTDGSNIATTSGTNTAHEPDRVGWHMYDDEIADLITLASP